MKSDDANAPVDPNADDPAEAERFSERRDFLILLSGGAALLGVAPLSGCESPTAPDSGSSESSSSDSGSSSSSSESSESSSSSSSSSGDDDDDDDSSSSSASLL